MRSRNQYGSAGRDQYNIGRDLNIRIGSRQRSANSILGSGDIVQGHDRRKTAAGGIGFVIASIIIAVVANSAVSGTTSPTIPFPTRNSPWPAGANVTSLETPVISRLQACAKAPVLAPVNCPQSQPDDYYTDVKHIHWSLHGDAASGAKVVYYKGQFYVGGNAVMVVTYSDAGGHNLVVQVVHYRAHVLWQDGGATLLGIKGVNTASGPVVAKQKPTVAWNKIREAVRSAFNKCAGARSAPLPPQCPVEQDSGIAGSKARWRLTADPLLNAQETFDPASGLIHIIGSFAMSVTYSVFLFGEQHNSEAGNYDATVSVDGAVTSQAPS